MYCYLFFFSSRRRHTRCGRDWSSDVCSSDLRCVVYQSATQRFDYYAASAGYALDECHVDKSGGWLALLETASDGSRINRIVDLRTQHVTTLRDVDGALGHLDMGFGYAVGADSYNPQPNGTILL